MTSGKRINLQRQQSPHHALVYLIESFYQRCYAKNLSEHTLSFYKYRFTAFQRYLAARHPDLPPEAITADVIRGFLADEAARISPLTANHSFVSLRALFRFLADEELLPTNPMVRVSKIRLRKKIIEAFTTEQLEQMLAVTRNDFSGLRLRAIIMVLVDCGLRVSELCGLTLDDINWGEQTLRVLGKGNKERITPFGATTMRALRNYLARRGHLDGNDAVFIMCYAEPLNRQRIHRLLQEVGQRACITGVRCSPHTFRHTFAVMYLRNGGDVFSLQKLLGHSDLAMTRRYAELSQTDVVKKHRQYSPGDTLSQPIPAGRKRLK